jgi:putative Mg2+ transporter-C (MgtC) family protein
MPFADFITNVFVALACGLIIGLERQWRQHPTGLRTTGLISLGACLFASLAILFEKESSPTRIAAQIVTGIGFLGGGVILRDGMNVKGLTTAATIWCTGAIGTLAGCGYLLFALTSTGCVLVVNIIMQPLSAWVDELTLNVKAMETRYLFQVRCKAEQSSAVRMLVVEYFQTHDKLLLQSIEQHDGDGDQVRIIAEFLSKKNCQQMIERLMGVLQLEHGVLETRWEKATTTNGA